MSRFKRKRVLLLPYLSDAIPKQTLPSKVPNWNNVCVKPVSHFLSHIKSHSIIIVLVNIEVSYSGSGHGQVALLTEPLQVYSTFGERNIMAIWWNATGNLDRNISKQRHSWYLPKEPVAFWIRSWVGAAGDSFVLTPGREFSQSNYASRAFKSKGILYE